MIQDYIESIHTNNGIESYYLKDEIFDDLLKQGILQKEMFKWFYNQKKSPYAKAKLLTLDYLKQTHQSNFKILPFNPLFYAYLVWSLKEYLIGHNETAKIQDTHHFLFNLGAYQQEKVERFQNNAKFFYGNLLHRKNISSETPIILYQFSSPNELYHSNTKTSTFPPSPLGNYYFELEDNPNTFIEYYHRIYPSIKTLLKVGIKKCF